MRILFVVKMMAALVVIAAGCTPAVHSGQRTGGRAGAAGKPGVSGPSAATAKYTFLDTLNRGKEIVLSPDDLSAVTAAPPSAPPAPTTQAASPATKTSAAPAAPSTAKPAQGPNFRIQILAASQIDMVRREKANAEAATGLPGTILSEQSLHKLYVGEFKTRAEADAALPDVRKSYPDAWIVTDK